MASKQGPTVPIFDSEGHLKGSVPNGGKSAPTASAIPPIETVVGMPGTAKGFLKAQAMLEEAYRRPQNKWWFAKEITITKGTFTITLTSKSVEELAKVAQYSSQAPSIFNFKVCNKHDENSTILDRLLCNAGFRVDPYSNKFGQPYLPWRAPTENLIVDNALEDQPLVPVLELADYLMSMGAGIQGEFSGFKGTLDEENHVDARFGADAGSHDLKYENLVLTSEAELETLRNKAQSFDALKPATVIVAEGKYNNLGSYVEGAHCIESTLVGRRSDDSEIWIQVFECHDGSMVSAKQFERSRAVTIISNKEYLKE